MVSCNVGQFGNIPRFYFSACPGRFTQKGQAGLHAGVVLKAADWNLISHKLPSMASDETGDDRLQRDTVQWIIGFHGDLRLGPEDFFEQISGAGGGVRADLFFFFTDREV